VVDLTSIPGFTGQSYTSLFNTALTAARGSAGSAGRGAQGGQTAATTPWDFRVTQPRDVDAANTALRAARLIDTRNPADADQRLPDDQRRLFSLYRGLQSLQALAANAADATTSAARAAELDRRFQTGLAEVQTYVDRLRLNDLEVFYGTKTERAETSLIVDRQRNERTFRPVTRGASTAEVQGIATAEPFTIRVQTRNGTTDVAIDLSQMTQAPRSIGAVAGFINQQLEAAGFRTRMQRAEGPALPPQAGQAGTTRQWGLRVQGTPGETLTFLASAPRASVSVLTQNGAAAELRKFDVSGSEPSLVSRTAIDAANRDMAVMHTVRDADGNVFVTGTTNASFGGQINQAPRDAVLRKLDSAGNVLWTKLLGSASEAQGLALAVGPDGSAVVAGQLAGRLGTSQSAGGADAFVVKYDADGAEVFAETIGTRADDRATALSVAADGSIWVAGQTRAALAGQTNDPQANAGGHDAFVMRLSATGQRQFVRQWGTAAEDGPGAMTLTADGEAVIASSEGGRAVVRKLNAAGADAWVKDLGELQGGAITALVRDGSRFYLGGGTGNAALTANGEASVAVSHNGGQDGFVLALDDTGASAAAAFVTYIGSGAADRVNGLAVSGGRVFAAGDTGGELPGTTRPTGERRSAFLSEISAGGPPSWTRQFATNSTADTFGRGLVADEQGASTLDLLGLPRGTVSFARPQQIVAQSTVRAGDYFEVAVNGGTARRVTVTAQDTMQSFATKVTTALQFQGRAEVVRTATGERLRIVPVGDGAIELRAGPRDLNALAGLGLAPGRVMQDENPAAGEAPDPDAELAYGLNLLPSYSLGDRTSAAAARTAIAGALQQIRDASGVLTYDPRAERLLQAQNSREVSPAVRAQIANYTAGLQRLTGGGFSA